MCPLFNRELCDVAKNARHKREINHSSCLFLGSKKGWDKPLFSVPFSNATKNLKSGKEFVPNFPWLKHFNLLK